MYKQTYKQKWIEKHQQKEKAIIKGKKQKGSVSYKRRKRSVIIDDSIKQGLTIATIKNVERAGNDEFLKAYRELLSPLVLDKQLLKVLAKEETISKLRNRIEQKFTFNGEAEIGRGEYSGIEEKLGQAIMIGQKTPRESSQIILGILQNNNLIYLHNGAGSGAINKLEQSGYNYKHQQNGRADSTDLTLIFRKA